MPSHASGTTDESSGRFGRILGRLTKSSAQLQADDLHHASVRRGATPIAELAVSYTHLDVYKRQDLSGEELSYRVIPRQADEFTCSRCFLVHHRSQLAKNVNGQMVCRECVA